MAQPYTLAELQAQFLELISQDNAVCFIALNTKQAIGFAQCQLRHDYVEGTHTSPVGYLEGIFIEKEYRHQGFARELLAQCENWAKQKGCSKFASDCEIANDSSREFHLATGFAEANRIICFKKDI